MWGECKTFTRENDAKHMGRRCVLGEGAEVGGVLDLDGRAEKWLRKAYG